MLYSTVICLLVYKEAVDSKPCFIFSFIVTSLYVNVMRVKIFDEVLKCPL